ncbi:hypothetical protein C8R47DRAFT_474401 [Mycena vitilis]|nr:hypothetical protein C8R47DRAFT_474401 [Mycena vitilis]
MVETVLSLLLCFSVFIQRSTCQLSVDPDPSSSGVVGGSPLPVTAAAPSAITSNLAVPLDPGAVGTSELAITDTWTSSGAPVTRPTTPPSTTSSTSSALPPVGSTIWDGDTTTALPSSLTSSTSLDVPSIRSGFLCHHIFAPNSSAYSRIPSTTTERSSTPAINSASGYVVSSPLQMH